ncbi:unnamed protein product [Blepharisma stoltei]|uniref:Uncharacterized protein n=1 Tax=Blepharisma stoltei TaxID=1481888 RepID=A0AAU9IHT8_9CILI|nr:unnamed protein product [Blepharisma stoltei]
MGCSNTRFKTRSNQRVFIIKASQPRIVAGSVEKKKQASSEKGFVSDIIKLHSVEVSFAMIEKSQVHHGTGNSFDDGLKNVKAGHKPSKSLIKRESDQGLDSDTMSTGKVEA